MDVAVNGTSQWRHFDLRPSSLLSALWGRLVVEWSRDAVNWAKSESAASAFPVIEIADPGAVLFPDFDRVLVSHRELRDVIEDSRYAAWRTTLGSVQGGHLPESLVEARWSSGAALRRSTSCASPRRSAVIEFAAMGNEYWGQVRFRSRCASPRASR